MGDVVAVEQCSIAHHCCQDDQVVHQPHQSEHSFRDEVQGGQQVEQQQQQQEQHVCAVQQHYALHCEQLPPHVASDHGHIVEVVQQLRWIEKDSVSAGSYSVHGMR